MEQEHLLIRVIQGCNSFFDCLAKDASMPEDQGMILDGGNLCGRRCSRSVPMCVFLLLNLIIPSKTLRPAGSKTRARKVQEFMLGVYDDGACCMREPVGSAAPWL